MGRCNIVVADSFILLVAVAFLLDGTGVVPWFLLAAGVHELGHVLAILLCRGWITQFRLTCAGGMLQYYLPQETHAQRAWIAGAGSLAGIGLALYAMYAHHAVLAGASTLLSGFNLLPIPPLDGATICQALCPYPKVQQMLSDLCLLGLFLTGGVVAYQTHGCGVLLVAGMLAGMRYTSQSQAAIPILHKNRRNT